MMTSGIERKTSTAELETARNAASIRSPLLRGVASLAAILLLTDALHAAQSQATSPSPHSRAEDVQEEQLTRQRAFHPAQWPREELAYYLKLQSDSPHARRELRKRQLSAAGSNAMIGAATEPFAVHVGFKVLQEGGTAADALIATSLAQIALTAGAAVSYAGIMNVVYFDSVSGKVHSLNAGFNTVQQETDPLSIPRREPSGRTALVPGYMAGIEALHRRFGTIAFADLLAPAIWIAEEGVPLNGVTFRQMQHYEKALSRLPETRKVFTKADGSAYKEGETFRQPQLAQTLRRVAHEGVSYMYRGDWARHFVAAVGRDGGKLTLEDMAAYRVEWTDPMRISYGSFEVTSIGGTHRGARVTLGSLKAAELADLKQYGHYTRSAQTLLYLIQINAIQNQLASPIAERRASAVPGLDPTPQSQISRETAERIVAHIRQNMRDATGEVTEGSHTSPIVVVDARGNVASLVPSINTASWGGTGIFVDGVSVPDSAKFQQPVIASVGPGVRLPDPTNPLLVLRNGKPVLTCGAMGGNGLPSLVLQRLVSILEFGTDAASAAAEPYTLGTYLGGGRAGAAEVKKEVILTGTFSPIVIEHLQALGQAVEVMPESQQEAQWIAIQIDPLTKQLRPGATRELPALIEAY